MADEKPYAPTASRLRKARLDGNIPQTTELVAFSSYLLGCVSVNLLLLAIAAISVTVVRKRLSDLANGVHTEQPTNADYQLLIMVMGILVMAGIGAIGMACLLGNVRWKSPSFAWNKLSPGANIKRIFAKETFFSALRAFGLTAFLVWLIFSQVLHTTQSLLGILDLASRTRLVAHAVQGTLGWILAVGGVFAGYESRSSWSKWHRQLRMTLEEIIRENREQNGDPHQRSQRKRRHRRFSRGGVNAIRGATVIVTNPTHIAIALLYDPPAVTVPIVVARGADLAANTIRKIAVDAHIPIVENIQLARLLFARTDEGDVIPLEAYALVAPLIAQALVKEKSR